MSPDQLFAPEPFEQMPGQLAMTELEHSAYWRVTYADGAEIVYARSAASAVEVFGRYVPAGGEREALLVECLPFGLEAKGQGEGLLGYPATERRWILARCHCCREDFYASKQLEPYCARCMAVGDGC